MNEKSESRLKIFNIYISSLKKHELNEDWDSAHDNGNNALLNLLAVAVLECETVDAGVAFMKAQGGLEILDKCEELAQRRAPEKQFMMFCTLGVVHIASLLGRHEIAEHYVARSQQPDRMFWDEYARALQCLVNKQPYVSKLDKLKKSDFLPPMKYWAVYLPFVSDVTHGRDFSSSLAAMRESFLKRIKDKRFGRVDGGLILEGSGHHPTHWDFRTEGLKAYVTYKYGLTFPS